MNKVLLIRTDAGPEIGLGHVMRCLALAQAWTSAGGTAQFAMRLPGGTMVQRLADEGMAIRPLVSDVGTRADALETASEAVRIGARWIVVDGYSFGAEYQETLKESGARLCLIDDLDSRYAMLRQEFIQWRAWQRETPQVAHGLLIALGGGDLENITLKVLRALDLVHLSDLEATVVVGGANPHGAKLTAAASKCRYPVTIRSAVTDMAELMSSADMAISAAGSTSWELAFMGLPSLLMPVAENQKPLAELFDRAKVSLNLGWHRDVSPQQIAAAIQSLAVSSDLRATMTRRGRAIVDGFGAERLTRRLLAPPVVLRPATLEDCELLWTWRNDPVVRSLSFSSDVISWETHLQWLKARLADPLCRIYIGVDHDNCPTGQIRVTLEGPRDAVVHLSTASAMRRRGYASAMLLAIQDEMLRLDLADSVHAYIRPINWASLGAFEKAGFVETEECEVQGQAARHYVCALAEPSR